MKTKIIFSAALLLLAFSFLSFKEKGRIENLQDTTKKFLIGAMHNGIDAGYEHNTEPMLNVWHHYSGPRNFGWPGVSNDSMGTPTSQYSNAIRSRLDSNNSHNMFTLMDRPKFQYLAFGQRSDYQCESLAVDSDYWFYGYRTHDVGRSVADSGEMVVHCSTDNGQGWIVKDLISNREQANYRWNEWMNDDHYRWFILPRIRINSSDVLTNKKVCKIEVLSWDSTVVDTFTIRARNFLDDQFIYNGQYISQFFDTLGNEIDYSFGPGKVLNPLDSFFTKNEHCKIDFRVWYYGECEMWIDRIRVENLPAHRLLTMNDSLARQMIEEEVNQITLPELNSGNPSPLKYYVEEFEFNTVPCMAYINKMVDSLTDQKMSFMVNLNYELFNAHIPDYGAHWFTPEDVKAYLIDRMDAKEIFMGAYSLEGWSLSDDTGKVSKSPSTLPLYSSYNGDYDRNLGILSYKTSPMAYDNWLQNYFDDYNSGWKGTKYTYLMRMGESISKLCNIPFYNMMQAHLWWASGHKLKEPTNEELAMMAYLAVSYGVKGILYFCYSSHSETFSVADTLNYSRGLVNTNMTPRTSSVYGQNKWDAIKEIDSALVKWSPHIMSFDTTSRSYIYRIPAERSQMTGNTFVSELRSYPHVEFSPDPIPDLDNLPYESGDSVYVQAAFFGKPNDTGINKYFMIVNRRCSPFIDNSSPANIGGRRLVSFRVNSSLLQGFTNWKIFDLASDSLVRVFSKNDTSQFYLGDFMPGEGKLFRVAPVMQEGGTLIADEDCGGFEFECRGEVNNDGHDVSIKPQTTILFANATARINMDGGSFYSGSSSESIPLYLKAKSGDTWKGLKLGNCEEAHLRNTVFENISPYLVDSTYAVELTDCGNIQITNCTFESSPTGKTGSLLINYTSQGNPEDVYISGNTFELNIGSMPSVSVISTGYDEIPMLMEWNEFQSTSENNTVALLLSNTVGGAIKESNFTGYDKTIFMLGSSTDVYGNYIAGSDQSSKGIIQYAGSNAILSPVSEIFTGGYNYISVEGSAAKCMELTNSYLLIDEGYNTFRLEDSQTGNYHLEGTIPNDFGADPYPAENNCFQIGNGLLVKHNLRWIDETAINLDTVPSSCNSERPENLIVFELENGISDTLHYSSGGSGSGAGKSTKAITESALSPEESQTVSVNSLKDSVTINLRKRNYDIVSASCRELLTTLADSTSDASLIAKLYLAELKLDVNHNGLSELKSFLESYVLDNPEKEMMIRQAFYFIQKCKVTLGLYESAMSGFQQIINQFPYSYEGLLASWDYATVSLLNSQGGSGGGMNSTITTQVGLYDETENYVDDPNDAYDNKKFSPADRRTLNENLSKTFTTLTEKQTREIEILEEKIAKSEATNTEKKKYSEMKTLKEIVKARKPQTVPMHLSMITEDLSKIVKSEASDYSDRTEENILPDEFALHQNYPNPFNPSTKIAFDIPRDSRVSLTIYDLLGREVIRIVNNELKAAGRYTYDFKGESLASGVYFYRIQAGTFVETKRMVLVK